MIADGSSRRPEKNDVLVCLYDSCSWGLMNLHDQNEIGVPRGDSYSSRLAKRRRHRDAATECHLFFLPSSPEECASPQESWSRWSERGGHFTAFSLTFLRCPPPPALLDPNRMICTIFRTSTCASWMATGVTTRTWRAATASAPQLATSISTARNTEWPTRSLMSVPAICLLRLVRSPSLKIGLKLPPLSGALIRKSFFGATNSHREL